MLKWAHCKVIFKGCDFCSAELLQFVSKREYFSSSVEASMDSLCNTWVREGAPEGSRKLYNAHHQFPIGGSYYTSEVGAVEGALSGELPGMPQFDICLPDIYYS